MLCTPRLDESGVPPEQHACAKINSLLNISKHKIHKVLRFDSANILVYPDQVFIKKQSLKDRHFSFVELSQVYLLEQLSRIEAP